MYRPPLRSAPPHQSAMIVPDDDKAPPPYSKKAPSIVSNASASRRATTLNGLPAHLLLQVIYWTCPDGIDGEHRRMMLYWMCTSLRYVSRDLWIGACLANPRITHCATRTFEAYWLTSFATSKPLATMHILRSSYLALYTKQVLRPFSTDPFPSANPIATPRPVSYLADVIEYDVTPIISTQRETAVLDSFILIRARQDMRSDESDLYLDNDDSDERYRDMFNYIQVRSVPNIFSNGSSFLFLQCLEPKSLLGIVASRTARRPRMQVRNSIRPHFPSRSHLQPL